MINLVLCGLYLLKDYLDGGFTPSRKTRGVVDGLLRSGLGPDDVAAEHIGLDKLIQRVATIKDTPDVK